MYYVDNKLYDLMKLKPSMDNTALLARNLTGFETNIVNAWDEIMQKTRGGKKIRFKCPHIGQMTKHQGGSFPRSVTVYDETGSHRIVWCENAIPQPNGGFDFRPGSFKYEKATFELDPMKDIEAILWHVCFSPLRKQTITMVDGKKNFDRAKLYMVDTEKEANEYLDEAGKSGAAIFYLTQSHQHMSDDDFVNAMASLYEISKPELLSNAVKRQKMLVMITSADNTGDKDKDSSFFIKCVHDYEEGDAYSKLLILVQKAYDRQLIGLDQQLMKVYLRGANNVNLANWFNVQPTELNRWKKSFARYLMGQPEKVDILESGIEDKPITPREQRKFYLPTPLTEEWFKRKEGDGGMPWNEMKALVGMIPGVDSNSARMIKRPEATSLLITYFIKEGKTIDPALMKSEP